MAVKNILRIGDEFLLKIAQPVTKYATPELAALVQDLFDTMHAADGAGLAAPQIGVGLRVVIIGSKDNPRYPNREPVPTTVLVNPEITPLDGEIMEDWEGCLSVPKMRGWVPRHRRIRYRAHTPEGAIIDREVEGFHARVVQHECDHLDGILYPQRVSDMRRFGFEQELFKERLSQAENDGEA